MIRRISSILSIVFILTGSARAQEVKAGWGYKLGVEERFRYEYQKNFNFSDALKDDGGLFFNRARVNAKLYLTGENLKDMFEIFVEGLDAQVGGYRINAVTSQKDNFDFHQGYLKIYDIGNAKLDATLGRQELKYGKGRLIWAPTWSNRIRSFDAGVLHYAPGAFYGDILYGQDVKYDDPNFNASTDEEYLGGFYGGYRKDKVSPLFEGYFLTQLVETGTSNIRRYTIGGQIEGRIFDDIIWNLELPYQFGTTGSLDISAYALHFDVSKVFNKWRGEPKFMLTFELASGDKKSGDNRSNTFNPLYQSTHDPYGIMDFFRWQNMREVEASVVLSISSKFRLQPQVDFFWLDSTKDSWVNSTGAVLRSGTTRNVSSFVGIESSLRAYYDITKNIKIEAGYAHFFSGGFVCDTGACDDADWAYSQINFKY
ncbi:MAG TPA: alginate export family protein [Candidatus Omnitrophota bacterium]|nr:alginate export family protein [Candidatus Omnitrophota bacterium]